MCSLNPAITGTMNDCVSTFNLNPLPNDVTINWSSKYGYLSVINGQGTSAVTIKRNQNTTDTLFATLTNSCGASLVVKKAITALSITVTPGGNGYCGEATVSVAIPSGNAFTWVVTGDLEINAIGQTVNNTDNTIEITGTSGTISVTTSACGTPITLTYDYQPYARNLTAGYMPIVNSEPLSVSIIDLDYSYDYINWYIDNVLVETGGGNLFYTNPPCGEHVVRAEALLPCGSTVVVGSIDFDRYCGGWWRSMSIFPNPASAYLSIAPDLEKVKTLSAAEKLSRKEYEVSLYDIKGKLVLKGKSTDLKLNLDTRSLKSDNYFLHIRIVGEKEIMKRQVIIKN